MDTAPKLPLYDSMRPIQEIFSYFLIFVFVFGLSLFRFGMHYDEVLDFFGLAQGTYLSMNRSGLYLYRMLMGEGANAWASPLVAGLFMSIAIYFQARLFNIKSALTKFIFAGLVLSSYQFMYVLRYSIQCDAVALTYILTTFAAYFTLTSTVRMLYRLPIAVLLLAFSLSVYESTFLYFCAVIIIVFLKRLLEMSVPPSIKELVRLSFIIIFSIIIWYSVSSMTNYRLTTDVYNYVEFYREQRDARIDSLRISPWLHVVSFLFLVKLAFQQALYLVENYHGFFYLKTVSYLQVSVILPIVYLLLYLYKNYRFLHFLLGSAMIISLWVSPYLLNLALRGLSGTHSWLAEPLILGILWTLAYQYRPQLLRREGPSLITRVVVISCVSFCLIKNCYRVSAHERYMAHYAELLKKTLCQIEEYGIEESLRQKKTISLVLVHSDKDGGTIGAGYNLAPFYQLFDIKNIRSSKKNEISSLQERMAPMPLWPSHQSILQEGSVYYIKVPHLYAGAKPDALPF